MVQSNQFGGYPNVSPDEHIAGFFQYWNTVKMNNVSDDVIRLRGSGLPIGDTDPESTRDFDSGSLVDSGLGLPISDPNPSTEVAGDLYGCRRPWWRVRGRRLVAPTPSPFDFS
ncbi:hypothetical protein CRG98_005618 [Punica granatum]|uniref:Uncharacterized protein n=1 Tax=Punica granatum TaxID=22663 RepID=A0A2I0KZW1_PUNGR|nr:hypothetical protein CRG98_005618 [Punica granatum]